MAEGIAYCRVSHRDQIQGTSLDSQRRACLEYAEKKGITITRVFVEKGESATAADRTELLKALDYCKTQRGNTTAFVVWKLDRFARNLTDHYGVQAQLLKHGTRLHSVTEEIISEGPIGKMTEAVLAGYAQFENDIRKQRCEGGMRARLRDGIRPWMPPLGYVHSKARTDRRKLTPDEPDPQRFALIQRGMRLYMTGEHTITRLTEISNAWGLRTRTNRPMRKQLWETMLTDKFYAGILIDPWTEEEHRGHHRPMISLEEYDSICAVKRSLSNNTSNRRLLYHPDFPLRGTVQCGCGFLLTASWQKGRNKYYPRYRCHSTVCEQKVSLSKKDLETKFFSFLTHVTPNDQFIRLFSRIVQDEWEGTHAATGLEKAHYERAIQQIAERRHQATLLRVSGEITKEDLRELRNTFDNQLTALGISKHEATTSELDLESSIACAVTFIRDIAQKWQNVEDPATRARLQRLVLPKGIAYDKTGERFGTAVLSPVFKLNHEYLNQRSDLVALVRRDWHPIIAWLADVRCYAEAPTSVQP